MEQRKLERIAFAAPKAWLMDLVLQIKEAGYDVKLDMRMGKVEAFLDDEVMFRAIEVNMGFWYVAAVEGFATEVEDA